MEVSPLTPISRRASFTSSSRCGLMTARISFIRSSQARTPRQEVLLRRRRLLLPRGGLLRSRLLLRGLDRLLQRLHQIDHLGRLGLRDDLDLLARDLLLDDPEQRLPIFVLELRRAELVGEVVDEALGHLHFLRPDIDLLVEDLELGRPDLVRPVHRLQHEDVVFEAQCAEMLLLPQGDLGHRYPAVLRHGLSEQRVRLHPGLFGDHVVGPLEVERIDLLQVDELHDVDGPAGLYGNRGEVLVLEHDVLVLLVLVSLHDVLEGNFLAIGGAHPLVLDAPVVLVVELVEAKRLLLRRWEQADRDGDQAEGDRSFPHGSRHDTPPGKKQPPVGGALIVLPPSYPSGSSARLDSSPRYDGNMAGKRGSGPAFTVEFPTPLLAEKKGEHWWMVVDGQELRLSNLDKVFWPDEGYTKGDLVAYYFNVAPLIIPYLAGRPLTMKRMPNGITGQFFYEKEAPSHTPDWMPRCAVESAGTGDGRWGPRKHEIINYLMVEHTAGLLFMANLGCIEFHPLHSRCGSIESPDYLFFDLDPFEPATFEDVLAVAALVRVVCDQLGLTSYPKISGATGMQVYVPIVPGFTYTDIREFVGKVGHLLRQADPKRVTMQWEVKRRSGKVFVDHNMNRVGANIAAVYSVRPEPGATVSIPVTWEEVEAGEVRPQDFTIATVWPHLKRRKDPFRGVLDAPQDITAALEAVGVERQPETLHTESHRVDVRGDGGKGNAGRPPGPLKARSRSAKAKVRTSEPAGKGGARSAATVKTGGRSAKSEEAIARSRDPKLGQYLEMRDFRATPEPAGDEPTATGNSFVIQRHDATRLHYDLRLERDGVLVSWSVPKGLPLVKGERHLAVQTEDHPIEYGSFAGTIPKGHYGAGEVRIWDRGTYDLLEWTDKKVSFRLNGERHRGEYHLVKTGRGERDWLILLGKASEESALARPPQFSPMLATPGYEPFDRAG